MFKATHNKPGSALLIALFLIATLGVVAFGSTRTYISEINTTKNLSATAGAYYSAEGALEIALLNYRLNKNAQWSADCPDPQNSSNCVVKDNQPMYSGLPNLANEATQKVRMSYLDTTLTGGPVAKDETREFVIPHGTNIATLSWQWNGTPPPNDKGGVIVNVVSASGQVSRRVDIDTSTTSTSIQNTVSPTTVRFRPMGKGLSSYTVSVAPDEIVDSGKTKIDGWGSYNGVTRQLRATLDRTTGRLDSVFDYTLFTRQGDIK